MAKHRPLAPNSARRGATGRAGTVRAAVGLGTWGAAKDAAAAVPATRITAVDAARGAAVLAMIAYHCAFDLRYYGLTRADFTHDPFWLNARTAIVTAFLLVVGVSLAITALQGRSWATYLRRTAIIGACAVAVTVGSYLLFPRSYIYFGILHAIVVMSLLAWPVARRPWVAGVVGVAVIAAGLAFTHPWFDARAASVLGFMTHKPVTEDYVPLFPWTGVMLLGVTLGHWLWRRDFAPLAWLARLPAGVPWLGRHSLVVYMVHQPLLLGGLWLVLRATGGR